MAEQFVKLVNPGGRVVEVEAAQARVYLAPEDTRWRKATDAEAKKQAGYPEGRQVDRQGDLVPRAGDVAASTDRVDVVNKEEGTQTEDLMAKTRAEVNNIASDLGVEFPEKMANKQAVVDAINEKRGGDENTTEDEE